MLEIIANVGAVLTGLDAAWIVWLGYQLARRQRADAWLENLNHLHGLFWQDPDFAEARECLASDAAYAELRESLENRFLRSAEMTHADYRRVEVLDKFLNFLIRVRIVDAQLEADKHLWTELSFSFWLEAVWQNRRWHILVYLQRFFGQTRIAPLVLPSRTHETDADLSAVRQRLLPAVTP